MTKFLPTRSPRPAEEGYILVAVIFMLALLVLSLSLAAPIIKKEIQRDREVETMHRGKQYLRAVQLYYKKFGAYPPNLDALVKPSGPGNIRFLRKKYLDPMTGKDDWKPILYGQNKAPTAMGFFGQPMMGSTMGGGMGGNGLNCPPSGGGSSSFGSSGSSFGSSGSSFGSSGSSFGSSGSSFGSGSPSGSSTCPTDASGVTPSSTDTSGATSGSTDTSGTAGNSTDTSSGTGSAGSTGLNAASGSSTPGSSTGTGLTGQTFGGGGIIGFSPGSPLKSILIYKKKDHYNQWEFVYDPITDQMVMGGGAAPTGSQSATSMSGGSSFGGSSGGSSFGGSGGSSFGGSGGSSFGGSGGSSFGGSSGGSSFGGSGGSSFGGSSGGSSFGGSSGGSSFGGSSTPTSPSPPQQ